ncbi:unnamed protein product [Larinioides sclopetarius]|uniref:Uncharacterized protein n=1 Tax=Larinioides sclopetarius TaxID=280406 RepID=A0AAV2AQV8_9ARAC
MPEFQTKAFAEFFGNFLTTYPKISNLLLSALASGGEQLIDQFGFQCPKDRGLASFMGWFYLLLPPLIILLITIVVNKKFWFLYHGYHHYKKKNQPNGNRDDQQNRDKPKRCNWLRNAFSCCKKKDQPNRDEGNDSNAERRDKQDRTPPLFPDALTAEMYENLMHTRSCSKAWIIVFRSLLVPCIWIVTALFDGDYLACSLKGEREDAEYIHLIKEVSRFAAWMILTAFTVIGTGGLFIIRCCDKNTFWQDFYEENYIRILQKEIKPRAKTKAKQDAKAFVARIGIVEQPVSVENNTDDEVQEANNGDQESNNGRKNQGNILVQNLRKLKNSVSSKPKSSVIEVQLEDFEIPLIKGSVAAQPGPSVSYAQQEDDGAKDGRYASA